MNNELDLQLALIELKREVADLKTAKKAGLIINMYNYLDENYQYATGLHKITFADGNQPLINTRPSSSTNLTFFTPVGNEQYFYWAGNGIIGELRIQSTREVLSVEWISS